jgi:ribosome-binding protein aMBF1 (putative translation factor)
MKKRDIKKLTKWDDVEKELLKDKSFVNVSKKVEYEYTLAKSIIQLRKENNLSQIELAKKAKTRQPVISRIETAVVKPSLRLLERLAEALGGRLEVKIVRQ